MISSYEEFKEYIDNDLNNKRMYYIIPKEWWTSEIINKVIFDDQLIQSKYAKLERLFYDFYDYKLKNVPFKFKTKILCEIAVEFNGHNLCYVPHILKTKSLCKKACRFDHYAIDYIPNYLKTNSFYKEILTDNIYSIAAFEEKYKTKKICEIAVAAFGLNLEYVPMELRTEELCNIAIENNPEADRWAPPGTSAYNNYIMKKALL